MGEKEIDNGDITENMDRLGEVILMDPRDNVTLFTFLSEFNDKWIGQTVIEVTVLTLIFLTSVIGNSLVLLVIVKCRKLRSATNFFIANLAMTDLLLSSGIPFIAITRVTSHWMFGDVICKLITYVQFIAGTCSILTMVMISVERYTYVRFSHRRRMTGNLACWVISAIWVVSIAFPVPIAQAQNERRIPHHNLTYVFCGIDWTDGFHADVYLISMGVLFFLVPLLVISAFYYKILNNVRNSSRRSQVRTSSRGTHLQMKLIKMSVLIVSVFVVMWLPFYVIGFFGVYTKSLSSSNFVITIIIAMSNSSLNPVIYGYFNSRFREEFRSFCCSRQQAEKPERPANIPSTEELE